MHITKPPSTAPPHTKTTTSAGSPSALLVLHTAQYTSLHLAYGTPYKHCKPYLLNETKRGQGVCDIVEPPSSCLEHYRGLSHLHKRQKTSRARCQTDQHYTPRTLMKQTDTDKTTFVHLQKTDDEHSCQTGERKRNRKTAMKPTDTKETDGHQ